MFKMKELSKWKVLLVSCLTGSFLTMVVFLFLYSNSRIALLCLNCISYYFQFYLEEQHSLLIFFKFLAIIFNLIIGLWLFIWLYLFLKNFNLHKNKEVFFSFLHIYYLEYIFLFHF